MTNFRQRVPYVLPVYGIFVYSVISHFGFESMTLVLVINSPFYIFSFYMTRQI